MSAVAEIGLFSLILFVTVSRGTHDAYPGSIIVHNYCPGLAPGPISTNPGSPDLESVKCL